MATESAEIPRRRGCVNVMGRPYERSQAGTLRARANTVLADDGVRLAYKTIGDGPINLVFVHGWASTKDYFDETIAEMNLGGLRVVCVDIRGHGESETSTGGFTVDQFAKDVLTVADHAGIGRFVALGHSMGAKYVQYLHLLDAKRVIGQVLIAGMTPELVDIGDEEIAEWLTWAGSAAKMLECHRSITSQPVPEDVSQNWAESASRVPAHVLERTAWAFRRERFGQKLEERRGSQPATLLLGGSEDPFFSPDHLRREVAARIPRSRLLVLNCGHEIPLEMPAVLAGLIEAFVAALPAAHIPDPTRPLPE
jgi:non-heme chloroperoxidase